MLFFVALKITAGRLRRPAVIKKRSKATALNLKLQTPVRSPTALRQTGIYRKIPRTNALTRSKPFLLKLKASKPLQTANVTG